MEEVSNDMMREMNDAGMRMIWMIAKSATMGCSYPELEQVKIAKLLNK